MEHTRGKPTGNPRETRLPMRFSEVPGGFSHGKRKREVPKVEGAAFSGAELVDLVEI